jgi:membrane-associated phospholipid phosphatase
MALAGFTGLARVEARKHYWHDVAAGAAIGGLSGLLLTSPLPDKRMTLAAWGDTKGGGISFGMQF